jgi:hypothetical protein
MPISIDSITPLRALLKAIIFRLRWEYKGYMFDPPREMARTKERPFIYGNYATQRH